MFEIPRLPRSIAREIAGRMVCVAPDELVAGAAVEHEQAAFPEVLCGAQVPPEVLLGVRSGLRAVLAPLGSPDAKNTQANRLFDVKVADEIFRRLPMAPRTAADPDVWNFLCCVLLPDVSRWRFVETSDTRRFLGGPRNTLQRLWLRAAVLAGTDDGHLRLLRLLPEDALVQIFERPAVWADWDLARDIAALLADRIERPGGRKNFEAVARAALLEIRQLMPIANLSALPSASRLAVLHKVVDV